MNCPVRNPKAEVVTEIKTEYCFIQNTLYRKDGRCGSNFKLSNGTAAQCDPESQFPCCSEFGYCGATQEHCDCPNCIDYGNGKELLSKDTSFETNTLYRKDGRCGCDFKLSNGTAAQCDPESVFPCCSEFGYCGVTQEHCDCSNCIDYRKGKELLPKYTSFQTSYQRKSQWIFNKILGIQVPY